MLSLALDASELRNISGLPTEPALREASLAEPTDLVVADLLEVADGIIEAETL